MKKRINRRDFLMTGAGAGAGTILAADSVAAQVGSAVAATAPGATLRWLDDAAPAAHEGVTWGQPWPRGSRWSARGYRLAEHRAAVQSWPLAWWPDGSIKWTGHALAAGGGPAGLLALRPGVAARSAAPVSVREAGDALEVTAGPVVWTLGRSGTDLIRSARHGGREVMRAVRLIATAQDMPDDEGEGPGATRRRYESAITAATVEQRGPVRAVVRIEGRHRGGNGEGGEEWLPFSVRLYFHAGSESVRIVHSLVFDGDVATRFIRGLGLSAEVPTPDALHDRHVRFAGPDGGLWAEAVRPLTGLRRDPGAAFRAAQVAGRAVPSLETMPPAIRDELRFIPAWGDFTLAQPTCDGFTITKRTKPGHGWIDVDAATRAPGFGYVGGPSGGCGFGMHDFWQRTPTRLDIRDAAGAAARVTLWYHDPAARPLDLRFYHDGLGMTDHVRENQGLDITYEDYEAGWGDARGIARTTEFRLWACAATPSRERLVEMAALVSRPPRLVATPEAVLAAGMFGPWALPDRSTPRAAAIEARATREHDFYLGQIEQRRWYGFWNYGDVMHSYDADRHVWRYDIGGFAWDNSELSTDLWLWYGFLRTGRADLFRMAEGMTRHTGEVDVYHTGRFKGLGTRHGVQHWGDSSKQPRVSTAAYRRIHHYLTADERSGDLMRALLDSDRALLTVEIGRKVDARAGANTVPGGNGAVKAAAPLPPNHVFMQFGTSWASLVAAWLTEWERTRDTKWRDRIVAGMRTIAAAPRGWFTGGAPFDLATGRFVNVPDQVSISHLNGVFGVFEITAELLELLDEPAYRECWLDYCQYYNAPDAEFQARTGQPGRGRGLRQAHARFTAYAARYRDPALRARAWAEFAGPGDREARDQSRGIVRIDGAAVLKPVDELPGISTNDAAQWGLTAVQMMALIGAPPR